jgi:Spy/CpxP family protein refolding chaperone
MAKKVLGLGRLGMGLAVAFLGVAGIATVWAQEGGPDMGPHRPPMERAMGPRGDHGRWWNDAHAIEKFKLTDTQRKAMDDIYLQHRLTLVDLHATLEKEEIAMEPLMRADQPDEGKILSQIDRVAQARAALEKANARMLLGLRRQLTPEQWKQLEADRASHHGFGHDDGRPQHGGAGPHGQGGPGGGPGPGGPGPGGPGPNEPGSEE